MTTTFGPQLVGETEKALQALLRRALAGTGLDERLWVGLRVAGQPDATPLRPRLADRAQFDDADQLVTTLEQRGLVSNEVTTAAGDAMLETGPGEISRAERPDLGRPRGRGRGGSRAHRGPGPSPHSTAQCVIAPFSA